MKEPGYTPSHPCLFKVEFSTNPSSHTSRLVAAKGFKSHELLATIKIPPIPQATDSIRPGQPASQTRKEWSTIQISPTRHLEVNNDLLYMNHSCDPSAIIRITGPAESQTMLVIACDRGVDPGESITFFYPSTEWELARPFDCFCGYRDCLKVIRGAKHLGEDILRRQGANKHIWELKRKLQPRL